MSLNRLRQLLQPANTQPGQVVGVGANTVRVATPQGAMDVTPDGLLQVGDRVTIRGGRATKSQSAPSDRIEFEV